MIKRFGFTLAEVLITLGIIGIVAEMTIPTLMNKTQDMELKTAYKKSYSVLSQAFLLMITDNAESMKNICANGDTACLRDLFASKLNVVKKCDAGSVDSQCWPPTWTRLNNNPGWATGATTTGLALNDGTFIEFGSYFVNCDSATGSLFDCGSFGIDVNGLKKPNKIGKDIYFIHLMDNTIKPFGTPGDDVTSRAGYDCGGTGDGEICAYDYLYK